jgi:hypothetical protein
MISFRFGRSFVRPWVTTLVLAAILPRSAAAILVTTSAGIPADSPTIDFSQFASAGQISFDAGDPPFVIDALSSETVVLRPVSGTSPVALILGNDTPPGHPNNSYGLDLNGHWGPGRVGFLGIGTATEPAAVARIVFESGPVSQVGGLFNYPPSFPPVIMSALDANLSVLEQYTIDAVAPISTPGQTDAGEYRGIMRAQNDIFALQIIARFAVIDDIRFSRVPEPSVIGLSALAIALAALNSRAKR